MGRLALVPVLLEVILDSGCQEKKQGLVIVLLCSVYKERETCDAKFV